MYILILILLLFLILSTCVFNADPDPRAAGAKANRDAAELKCKPYEGAIPSTDPGYSGIYLLQKKRVPHGGGYTEEQKARYIDGLLKNTDISAELRARVLRKVATDGHAGAVASAGNLGKSRVVCYEMTTEEAVTVDAIIRGASVDEAPSPEAPQGRGTPATAPAQTPSDTDSGDAADEVYDTQTIHEGTAAIEQFRFLKQCYLLDSIEHLVKHRNNKRIQGKASGTSGGTNYVHFSCITDPAPEVLSELLGRRSIKPLLEIKESELAFLVPRIRLFKVYPDGKEAEFKFATHFSEEYFSNPNENYAQLTSPKDHHGQGAGIVSFSYELAGTNPAEADKLINAKIKFHFNAMRDLFAVRHSGGKRNLKFADLINYRSHDSAAHHRRYNEKHFRIKAIVGWSDPPPSITEIPDVLREALKRSRTVLFLQLVDHELGFKQDGTVSLEVNYIASIEAAFRNPALNVFWVPEDQSIKDLVDNATQRKVEIQALDKALINLEEDFRTDQKLTGAGLRRAQEIASETNLLDAVNKFVSSGNVGQNFKDAEINAALKEEGFTVEDYKEDYEEQEASLSAQRDALHEKHQHLIDEVSGHKELQRIKRYRRIVNDLVARAKIQTLYVSAAEIGIWKKAQILGTSAAIVRREQLQAQRQADPEIKEGRTPEEQEEWQEWEAKLKEQEKEYSAGEKSAGEQLVSTIKKAGEDGKAQLGKGLQDEVAIPYFYLGDLFDSIINIMKTNFSAPGIGSSKKKKAANKTARDILKEFSILMGPVVLKKAVKSKKKKRKPRVRRIVINLADIPVSLDVFLVWFFDEVVKPNAESYLLKDLFIAIISAMVPAALGYGCIDGLKQNVAPRVFPISSPRAMGGGSAYRIPQFGARCRKKDIKRARAAAYERAESPLSRMIHYMFFYAVETDEQSYLRGNETQDFNNGIYHLYVGREHGLIKDVKFKRTDFKGLRASRVVGDAQETKKDGYLRDKYDVTLTMVGNTLFYPGQYIYINPSMPGAPRRISEIMGLGGYFFVIEVNHMLQDQYYQTEVRAVWNAFAKRKGPLKRPVYIGADACKGRKPTAWELNDPVPIEWQESDEEPIYIPIEGTIVPGATLRELDEE